MYFFSVKKIFNLLVVLAAFAFVGGCTSGSSNNGSTENNQNITSSRTAFKGVVASGLFSSSKLLVSSNSNQQDSFQSNRQGEFAGEAAFGDCNLVTAIGGQGNDYSGNTTNNTKPIYLGFSEADKLNLSINIFTTIAAGYAKFLTKNGFTCSTAANFSNNTISQWLGFDITKNHPNVKLLTLSADIFTSSLNIDYRDLYFAAHNDIAHDGILNGVDGSGNITLNNTVINTDHYRYGLAKGIIDGLASGYFGSANAANLTALAESINTSELSIFGDSPITALPASEIKLDNVVAVPSLSSGVVSFNFLVSGNNFNQVKVFIDGAVMYSSTTKSNAGTLDTRNYGDGQHEFKIVATNIFGNDATYIKSFFISNNETLFKNVHPSEGLRISGSNVFSAKVLHSSGISQVIFYVGNRSFVAQRGSENVFTATVDTTPLPDGNNGFEIKAVNNLNQISTFQSSVIVENSSPRITLSSPAEGAFLSGNTVFSWLVNHIYATGSMSFYINDNLYHTWSNIGHVSYTLDTLNISDGQHRIKLAATDHRGIGSSLEKSFYVDNNNPQLTINIPNNTVVNDYFSVGFSFSDANGFGNNKHQILVDGAHYSYQENNNYTAIINPYNFSNGLHDVSVKVTDASGKSTTKTVTLNFQAR